MATFVVLVQVIAWFVVIFGIITTSDISKLLLLQFWNITSGIHAKYHVQIMILFVYTTTRKRFVIFTCRYFKLSWNTTALSQSNCRNLSCSRLLIVYSNNSIKILYYSDIYTTTWGLNFCNLIGLEQWYFSLIWNKYMWKSQTFCR